MLYSVKRSFDLELLDITALYCFYNLSGQFCVYQTCSCIQRLMFCIFIALCSCGLVAWSVCAIDELARKPYKAVVFWLTNMIISAP
jgi:hypothetical protein